MPNSDHVITRSQLVRRAFRRIGKFNPTTNDTLQATDLLNDLIKEIDVAGRWLWTISNTQSTLTLTSGNRTYSVATPPAGIESNILSLETFELLEGTSYTPLIIIDKTESLTTTLRENTGKPTHVFLETAPSMANQKIHLFQTPNGTYTAKYTYRRRLYDFDNASDNPDFPQEWAQKLAKILSYELCAEYGVPLAERQWLQAEAEQARQSGFAANSESSDPTVYETVYF